MNFFKGLVDVILADDDQSFDRLSSQARNSDVCLRLLRQYGVATVSNLSDVLRQNKEALEQLTKQVEIDTDTIYQLSQSLKVKQELENRLLDYKEQVVELEAECDELRTKDAINRANITQLTKELVYYKELVESKSEIISGLAIKLYKKDTVRDKTLESELAFAKASVKEMREMLSNFQKITAKSSISSEYSKIESLASIDSDDIKINPCKTNRADQMGDNIYNIKGVLGDLSELSSNILNNSTSRIRSGSMFRMASDGHQNHDSIDDSNDNRCFQSLLDREARAITVAEKFAIEIINNSQKDNGRSLLNSEAELLMDKKLTSLAAQVETIKSQMEAEREKYGKLAKINEELIATCAELKKMVNMSEERAEPPRPNKIEIVYINALDIVNLDLPPGLIESKAFESNNYSYGVGNQEHRDGEQHKVDNWGDFDEPWEEFTPKPEEKAPVERANKVLNDDIIKSPKGEKPSVWDEDLDCFDEV